MMGCHSISFFTAKALPISQKVYMELLQNCLPGEFICMISVGQAQISYPLGVGGGRGLLVVYAGWSARPSLFIVR
jgi:hypothetical protein